MSLGGFHGLMLQKKITQNDYKIVTIFHLSIYFLTQHAYVCVWFSNPLSTVLSRLEVFFCSGRMRL